MDSIVERPRLLHVRSECGYTDRLDQAVADEPEAVSAECQRQLSTQAARVAHDRRRETYDAARAAIEDNVHVLRLACHGLDVDGDLRLIEKTLDRLGRRIAAA